MKIADWLKYWGQLLLLPVYWMSFLVPRDRKLWLFGSTFGKRFADNPKYLYLYVSQHKKESGVRPVWISHDKSIVSMLCRNGYEAYYYHSPKGIWLAMRGKVYVFDNYSKDINFWQSGGAVKVNLWHGIPLKKIQADNLFDSFRHPRNLWEKWKNFPRNLSDEKPHHYVLATSKFIKPVFASAFRTRNVIVCGYPRIDYLVSDKFGNVMAESEKRELDIIREFKENSDIVKGEKAHIVCYMPTFRDSEIKFFDVIDNIDKFQEYLKKENILFCVKLHPKSKLQKEFMDFTEKGCGNILLVDASFDPYTLLKISDVLVTDYSSVYFDFMCLDRPVIFFCYDKYEYMSKSRELYFDYLEMTPGEKVETMGGLLRALGNACNMPDRYKNKYIEQNKIVMRKIFDIQYGFSSGRLVKKIKKITNI